MTIHVLARAVIIIDHQILLAYDPRLQPHHYYELDKEFYYLPGGHIEHHESAADAVIREISEETNHDATVERFLGVIEHAWQFKGDDICCHTHEINMIFKMHLQDLKSAISISQIEKHVAFRWVSLDQLSEIDLRPECLKTYLFRWLNENHHDAIVSRFPEHKFAGK